MKNAPWPQVKRGLLSAAGLGNPLCLHLSANPSQGTKPTLSSPKSDETETKHHLVMIILDLESCVGWRSPWRSRSSELPLKAGPNPTSPSASLCTVGTQEGAISNFSVLLWIAPHHLLLLSKPAGLWARSLLYSAALSKSVAWNGKLPQPPSVLCSGTSFVLCPSHIIFLGTQTERNPLHLLPSISPSLS